MGVIFCLVTAALLAGTAPLDASREASAAPGQPDVVIVGDCLTGGTNDLGVINNCGCPDPVAYAGSIIDQLLDEIGSDVPIAWVTVANRNQWDASRWFNAAITIRAARDPHIALIRWNELSASRPDWFVDHVHQNSTGVRVFTQMYIDRISALLANPLGPRPPGPGLAAAVRLGPP